MINFGERLLKAGIQRVVNGLPEALDFNAKPQRRKSSRGTRFTVGSSVLGVITCGAFAESEILLDYDVGSGQDSRQRSYSGLDVGLVGFRRPHPSFDRLAEVAAEYVHLKLKHDAGA